MKRSKRLCLLLGILVVACGATFAVSKYEEHKEKIENSEEVILSLDTGTVTSLSWECDSTKLAFHKDDNWIYDGDEAFPVNEEKLQEILGQFEEFGVSFRIDDVDDLGQYGLDDPVCTVEISAEDKQYTILLGDYSTMDSERYVSIGDGKVYLVKNDPYDYFDAALSDMIDHDEIPDLSDAANIEFSGKENYEIVYEQDSKQTYCADDVYFVKQDGKTIPLDTSLVNEYLQIIKSLKHTDYVSYNATQEELQSCGLDDPDLTVQVGYTTTNEEGQETSDTFILHIGYDEAGEKMEAQSSTKDKNSSSESVGSEDENQTTVFLRVDESKIIYKLVGEDSESLLSADVNSFRHHEVFPAELDVVDQIDITLENTEYTLVSSKDGDEKVWSYQGNEVDIDEFDRALSGLRIDSFRQETPDQMEEITLTLHLDNENFPQVQIGLYRYDGTRCLAVVDGEPMALVSRADVVDLIESVHAIVLGKEDS